MSRLGQLLRTGLAKFEWSSTSEETRGLLFREAAEWLETLERFADARERANFLNWACRSPEHIEAFSVMSDIMPALREKSPDRLQQVAKEAEGDAKSIASSKWASLPTHPLVKITGAVIATAGLTWAVANEVIVKPRDRQIEQLQAQLVSARKLVSPSADGTEDSDRSKPTSPRRSGADYDSTQRQRPDQEHSPPPINEGEVQKRLQR